ncbi:MAG: hypothetical protein HFJ03_06715 [Lachnospira sp.]|jgi:hypothetical protein|nr:hypothetical protein [Lachnospira sp.]
MKRKKYIFAIFLFILFLTGCNNNNIPEETKTQEYNAVIENPGIDVQEDSAPLSSFYTNFVIKDNYKIYTITENTKSNNVAVPNWQFKDRIVIDTADFINLMDDKIFDAVKKRRDFLNEKLRPSGMMTDKKEKRELFMKYKTPYVKEYMSSDNMFARAGQERERTAFTGLWHYGQNDSGDIIDKYNVVCMSINMYEGFYNFSNTTKLFIYGVSEETFENNLLENFMEDEDVGGKYEWYKQPDINAIIKKYHNEECQLDILAEIELVESGNYYMDFSEIIEKDEYKDIIIEMELTGEVTDEYTYAWYGFAYKIDNEQAYQDWKAKNTDKFVY